MVPETNIFASKQLFENETFDFVINEIGGDLTDDIEFKDCTFNFPVSIINLKINGNLRFSGCTFKHYTILKNIKCEIIGISYGNFNGTLNIHSCKSNSLNIASLTGDKCFINGEFKDIFFAHNFIEEIIFKDINNDHYYLNSELELRNNNIKKIEIKSSNLCSSLKFITGNYDTIILEGGFKESLIFEEDIKVKSLIFESSIFDKRIDIKNGNYENIYLYRSLFKGLFLVQDYDILEDSTNSLQIDNISIHANYFEKDITVYLSKKINYTISDNNFPYSLNIKSNSNFNNETEIDFNMSGTNYGNVVIENTKANIDLRCINFGTISFNEIETNSISLVEFQNYGKLSFFNIVPSKFKVGYIVFQDSKLGETEFLNTDFEKFHEIVIANSNISNIVLHKYFFNISSYNKNEMIGYGIKDKGENYSNLKNVYNQLKKSALNKGDIDSANRYQSLEYHNLFKNKKLSTDKILLFLNHVSNKNGYSWGRGILFTFLVSLFSFFIYIFLNEKENYLLSLHYFSNTLVEMENLRIWNKFIKFFTSFPKLTLDEYKKDSWEINLWIWLSRVFVGYGIYQTIAAFRKYGKS